MKLGFVLQEPSLSVIGHEAGPELPSNPGNTLGHAQKDGAPLPPRPRKGNSRRNTQFILWSRELPVEALITVRVKDGRTDAASAPPKQAAPWNKPVHRVEAVATQAGLEVDQFHGSRAVQYDIVGQVQIGGLVNNGNHADGARHGRESRGRRLAGFLPAVPHAACVS